MMLASLLQKFTPKPRLFKIILIFFFLFSGVLLASFYFFYSRRDSGNDAIKVGVLFSQTGTMAESEQPVINAVLLAINEINRKGGVRHKRLVPVVYDAQSNWHQYAILAQKMILEDKVSVIFGCWTSAARKEVKPIVEKYNHLLLYPAQYEGVEESDNIVYLGATPNQQIIPAVAWGIEHHWQRAYLVGSDSIFPHTANETLSHQFRSMGGEVVGVRYIPLGGSNVDAVVQDILKKKPDIIFNTIDGDTNVAFFKRLYDLSQNTRRPEVISFSLSAADMGRIGMDKIVGDYAVWSYFPTQDTIENQLFLQAYQKQYGTVEGLDDPAATAYSGVYLWAQAAQVSPVFSPSLVRTFMLRQSLASPAGVIYVDPITAHAWRTVMIGKVNPKGLSDIVWTSFNPIQPIVYPEFKTKAAWELFEYQLYLNWGHSWENTAHVN